MKKKYLSALMFGAMTLASTATFTSCEDYDDDIDGLSDRIEEVKKGVSELQSQIQKGVAIKNVSTTENGICIEMADGQKFNITNGKNGIDGTPGTKVAIGEDGFWYIDGAKTEFQAKGEKGDKGDPGAPGVPGGEGSEGQGVAGSSIYFEPGTEGEENGYWIKVSVDAEGKEVREKTANKWTTEACEAGGVVAIYGENSLVLKNVQGATEDVVITFSELESLVFIPEFVLDGHEAMEYLYIPFHKYEASKTKDLEGRLRVWCSDVNCEIPAGLSEPYIVNAEIDADEQWSYVYPYNHKPYHMNPSNAVVPELAKAAGGIGMASDDLNFERIPTARAYNPIYASANDAKAQPKGKYVKNEKGDMTIGISMQGEKIATQASLDEIPVSSPYLEDYYDIFNHEIGTKAGKMTVLAPSAKKALQDSVTANYAAVRGAQFAVADLAYYQNYAKNHVIKGYHFPAEQAYWQSHGVNGLVGFTNHETPDQNGYHLYSTIKEAAEMPSTVELVYTNDKGINLDELVEVHFLSNSPLPWNDEYPIHVKHTAAELAYYDLHLEFDLAGFFVGENQTRQDAFAYIEKDANMNSILYPCDVLSKDDIDQSQWEADKSKVGQGIAGVGKTPIVRVFLKNNYNETVKVGYIKFKITAPNNPLQTEAFNLEDFYLRCDEFSKVIAWHAISSKLYSISGHINTKAMFDKHYRVVKSANSGEGVAQFYNTGKFDKNGKPIYAEYPADEYVGVIKELHDDGAETTNVFEWAIDPTDFQNIYGMTDNVDYVPSIAVQRMVKYAPVAGTDGDAGFAKEPIYLPIDITLNYPQGVMSGKIDKYWFAENSNIKSGVALADRDYLHVSIQVPNENVEGIPSEPETPAIRFDLNSAFNTNEELGHAIANQTADWNVTAPVWNGSSLWVEENAPAIDFTAATPAEKFADFQAKNLVYYYYFTAANNGKKVVDVNGNEHTLFVKNTIKNYPVMSIAYTDLVKYEFFNTEIYVDNASDENLIATISHEELLQNGVFGKGDLSASFLELQNNEMAKLLLNTPEEWKGKNNSVDDLKLLQETLDLEIGVVAFNRCGLNFPLTNNIFKAEILKPVYAESTGKMEYTDAKDGVQKLNIFDYVNFYDWRQVGFDAKKNKGFYYNFYGVESMTVNVDEIRTNISGEMKPLKEVSGDVEFKFYPSKNGTVPAANATLAQLQAHFGQLVYGSNNGNLVEDFEFEVPVKIKHYWSEATLTVWVKGNKVNRTLGN